jgi:predicted transcriptional regulator
MDHSAISGLTAQIVSAYVSNHTVVVSELPQVIQSVRSALQFEPTKAAAPERPLPPVPINRTVRPDHIVSLEDGRKYKLLARHLRTKGLTPEQYRAKWGLPANYPMVAANYAAGRSELAKATGLGKRIHGR